MAKRRRKTEQGDEGGSALPTRLKHKIKVSKGGETSRGDVSNNEQAQRDFDKPARPARHCLRGKALQLCRTKVA